MTLAKVSYNAFCAAKLPIPAPTPMPATINWQTAIPAAPKSRSGRRPQASTIHNPGNVDATFTAYEERWKSAARCGFIGERGCGLAEVVMLTTNASLMPEFVKKDVP